MDLQHDAGGPSSKVVTISGLPESPIPPPHPHAATNNEENITDEASVSRSLMDALMEHAEHATMSTLTPQELASGGIEGGAGIDGERVVNGGSSSGSGTGDGLVGARGTKRPRKDSGSELTTFQIPVLPPLPGDGNPIGGGDAVENLEEDQVRKEIFRLRERLNFLESVVPGQSSSRATPTAGVGGGVGTGGEDLRSKAERDGDAHAAAQTLGRIAMMSQQHPTTTSSSPPNAVMETAPTVITDGIDPSLGAVYRHSDGMDYSEDRQISLFGGGGGNEPQDEGRHETDHHHSNPMSLVHDHEDSSHIRSLPTGHDYTHPQPHASSSAFFSAPSSSTAHNDGEEPMPKRKVRRKNPKRSAFDLDEYGNPLGPEPPKRFEVPVSGETGKRIKVKERQDQLARAIRDTMREEWGVKEEDPVPGPDGVGPDWAKGTSHPDNVAYQDALAIRVLESVQNGTCKYSLPPSQQQLDVVKQMVKTSFLNMMKRYLAETTDDAKLKALKNAKRGRRWARKDLKQRKRSKAASVMEDIPQFVLKLDYLSSEYSSEGEDSGLPDGLWDQFADDTGRANADEKVLEIRTPAWRSAELQKVFDEIDEVANQQVEQLKGKGHMAPPLRRFKLTGYLRPGRAPLDASDPWLYSDGIVPPEDERGKPIAKYKKLKLPKPRKIPEPRVPRAARAPRRRKGASSAVHMEEQQQQQHQQQHLGEEDAYGSMPSGMIPEMMEGDGAGREGEEDRIDNPLLGSHQVEMPAETEEALQALSHMEGVHEGQNAGYGMEAESEGHHLFDLPSPVNEPYSAESMHD